MMRFQTCWARILPNRLLRPITPKSSHISTSKGRLYDRMGRTYRCPCGVLFRFMAHSQKNFKENLSLACVVGVPSKGRLYDRPNLLTRELTFNLSHFRLEILLWIIELTAFISHASCFPFFFILITLYQLFLFQTLKYFHQILYHNLIPPIFFPEYPDWGIAKMIDYLFLCLIDTSKIRGFTLSIKDFFLFYSNINIL